MRIGASKRVSHENVEAKRYEGFTAVAGRDEEL